MHMKLLATFLQLLVPDIDYSLCIPPVVDQPLRRSLDALER